MDNNEIIEVDNKNVDTLFEQDKVEVSTDEIKIVEPPRKRRKLSKKGIIIIAIFSLVLISLGTLAVLYFTGFFDKKEEAPLKEDVVLEKENYTYKNGVLTFIDKNGVEIGTYTCTVKNKGKCMVSKYNNEDSTDVYKYVNKDGSLYEKTSSIYFNNYVFIKDDNKVLLYDIAKKEVKEELLLVKGNDNVSNMVVVKDLQGKYGVISFSLDGYSKLLDYEYDYLALVNSSNQFLLKEDGLYYVISSTGEKKSTDFNEEVVYFNENYVVTKKNGYNLYDFGGNLKSSNNDFVTLYKDYVVLVNDNKLYLYDSAFNLINPNGVILKNEYYVKEFVIDENNTFYKTNKAFDFEVSESNIKVLIESGKKTTSTSYKISDIEFNKNNSFVSYVTESYSSDISSTNLKEEGTIYIYKDKEKTNLLGKYECSSINDSNYNTCFIATETNIIYQDEKGYIPIINERYVFIKDNKVIYLYDLKENKTVVKYSAVESHISSSEITHVSSLSQLFTCKNTDGNYGMIELTASSVNGFISFKTDDGETTKNISMVNNYYYVQRSEKNYLYDTLGNEVASSKFDIIDYQNGYILVKDDKYLVYKNGSILSSSFDYIALYKTFFVGITGTSLNIYEYTSPKAKKIDDLTISQAILSESFELKESSTGYIITIIDEKTSNTDYKYDLNWEAK